MVEELETVKREADVIRVSWGCRQSQQLHRTVASLLLLCWTLTKTPFEDTELILIIPVGLILRDQCCLAISPQKRLTSVDRESQTLCP